MKATRLSITLALGILTGCSTFNRDWNEEPARVIIPTDISGHWQGSWRSEVNGHHGALRCIVRQEDEHHYQARYRAIYGKIFSFEYTVPITVERSRDLFTFKGEANLGKLAGGIYDYEGTASPTNFYSTYRSKYDHGVFQMTRPDQ